MPRLSLTTVKVNEQNTDVKRIHLPALSNALASRVIKQSAVGQPGSARIVRRFRAAVSLPPIFLPVDVLNRKIRFGG